VQDWTAIQPFVGMVTNDADAFLYAKAQLTRSAPPGTGIAIPALDAKSLGVLALFILLFGGMRFSQQRRKQR